ncbi:cytochrome P450 [Ceratobasidium sp. AG-I]|nr:cytochrome P450 [Ceratobasidium sp. AG-I]
MPCFNLDDLISLRNSAVQYAQTKPADFLFVAVCAVALSYAFKQMVVPSSYANVDGPPSPSFIYGHLKRIYSPDGIPFHDNLQDAYGSLSKIKGPFGSDRLYISDPRALHEILVKENENASGKSEYISARYYAECCTHTGNAHKVQRKMLNPVFTTKHMKARMWYQFMLLFLKEALMNELKGYGSKDLDMLKWCSATALELIGQAGLGHTFGIFQGVDSAYNRAIKGYLPAVFGLLPYQPVLSLGYNLIPKSLRQTIAQWVPNAGIQRLKEIIEIQDKQAEVILAKKKSILHETATEDQSHDIMSILLKANMEAAENERLPEEELLGQMNSLIFAGHETTSGALARVLHLLSMNLDVQDRLRAELQEAPANVDYNELHSLAYLDAICREVLRLYPPGTAIERKAMKDWVVPLRYPVKGKDGRELHEVNVKKGTAIHIALREANRCKETWGQDADEFKPNRWLEDRLSSVSEAKTSGVYSSMMTFSAGPRACIGFKFSVLELKVVLLMLVKNFKFAPANVPVEWRLGMAMTPYEAGAGSQMSSPSMPLNVSIA